MRITGASALFAIINILLAMPASADDGYDESISYGVDHFSGTHECNGNSNLVYPQDDAFNVEWAFGTYSNYDLVDAFTNHQVLARDVTDVSKKSYGLDTLDQSGSDSGDVFFISTHGSANCGAVPPRFDLAMGYDTNTCYPNSQGHMRFGNGTDGDAEVLLLAACQSNQKCMYDDGGIWEIEAPELTFINGFHGLSYDSYWASQRYAYYVSVSMSAGISDNWVDLLSTLVGTDQCATSTVFGEDGIDIADQHFYSGFDNWVPLSPHVTASYYFWCGCSPADGEPLPSC